MSRPLYCDESIWVPVADGLRQRGWEVHTARQHGRLGDTDREQLAFAVDRDWMLFTFDDDFLGLVETQGVQHAGVLYLNPSGMRIGDVVRSINAYLDDLEHGAPTIHYP